MDAERLLVWLLRFGGVVCLLGVVGLFLPIELMRRTHSAVGFGEFPTSPIAEYLARSTSGLCGLFGGLMILLSRDVRRYRGVIRYQAVGLLLISAALAVASMNSGVLLWFAAADAAACWAFFLPVLLLARKLNESR